MTGAIFGTADERSLHANELFALSRPLHHGEAIDFFLSHSWHDDAELKWQALERVAARFRASHGREATFWLDKTCIDQSNLADGLRVLPVNVMACRKMFVLWGSTYAQRLWCVWELFTMLAFASLEHVLERIEFASLLTTTCGAELGLRLMNFDVRHARCYDPNEESRIRGVIFALGEARFNDRIRALGTALYRRESSRSTSLAICAVASGARSSGESSQSRSWAVSAVTSGVGIASTGSTADSVPLAPDGIDLIVYLEESGGRFATHEL